MSFSRSLLGEDVEGRREGAFLLHVYSIRIFRELFVTYKTRLVLPGERRHVNKLDPGLVPNAVFSSRLWFPDFLPLI